MARYATSLRKAFITNYFSTVWEKVFTISFVVTLTIMMGGCTLSAMFGI